MSDEESAAKGLICAVLLDGTGGGREVGWAKVEAWRPGASTIWIHLDFRDADAIRWVRANVADPQAAETLLADETRPRSVPSGDHLLVTLRGVNLNPESDPDDMVSVRLWIGPERIVTTRHRRIMAINDAREALAAGQGPKTAGDFLVFAADRLMQRMGPTLDGIAETMDSLEGEILDGESDRAPSKSASGAFRRTLSEARRKAIGLRRYLAPQREAMTPLMGETVSWLTPAHKVQLRDVADHITRYVEDLDALRDRGAVIQDELRNRVSEDMNRTIYVLTVVAAVLLPLSFVTGLLGVNVDGLPGAKDAPDAFWLVTGGLTLVAAILVWLFRRLRWL